MVDPVIWTIRECWHMTNCSLIATTAIAFEVVFVPCLATARCIFHLTTTTWRLDSTGLFKSYTNGLCIYCTAIPTENIRVKRDHQPNAAHPNDAHPPSLTKFVSSRCKTSQPAHPWPKHLNRRLIRAKPRTIRPTPKFVFRLYVCALPACKTLPPKVKSREGRIQRPEPGTSAQCDTM